MQYIESSVIGLRSAIITLRRTGSALRFTVFPMVHVGEPDFYHEVAARVRTCDLIVAEGAPSGEFPIQEWMSSIRWDHLVDQLTALDLESLGVPIQWEYQAPEQPGSARQDMTAKIVDSAAAVTLRALGRYGNPLGLPSLEQADEHDDRWMYREPGRFARFLQERFPDNRDAQLVRALGVIHRERYTEPINIAVVYGAAHIPAVVDYLSETFRYRVQRAEWLIVAHAPV